MLWHRDRLWRCQRSQLGTLSSVCGCETGGCTGRHDDGCRGRFFLRASLRVTAASVGLRKRIWLAGFVGARVVVFLEIGLVLSGARLQHRIRSWIGAALVCDGWDIDVWHGERRESCRRDYLRLGNGSRRRGLGSILWRSFLERGSPLCGTSRLRVHLAGAGF